MVSVLLGNLGIQFKGAFGIALALEAAGIRIKLDGVSFIERRRKHFG